MVNGTPEEAMRRACDAILQGDVMTAMADLSPEAFNEAMIMGGQISSVPTPESYSIESHEESNGVHRFQVRFKTSVRDVMAHATWRQIDGAWRITSISADGLQQ
jgi:hypothetical protein